MAAQDTRKGHEQLRSLLQFEPIPGAKLHFEFDDNPGPDGYRGYMYATLPDDHFSEVVLISLDETADFTQMESMEEKMAFMRGKFADAYEKLKAKVEAHHSSIRP